VFLASAVPCAAKYTASMTATSLLKQPRTVKSGLLYNFSLSFKRTYIMINHRSVFCSQINLFTLDDQLSSTSQHSLSFSLITTEVTHTLKTLLFLLFSSFSHILQWFHHILVTTPTKTHNTNTTVKKSARMHCQVSHNKLSPTEMRYQILMETSMKTTVLGCYATVWQKLTEVSKVLTVSITRL
jgi:hypothetical protein